MRYRPYLIAFFLIIVVLITLAPVSGLAQSSAWPAPVQPKTGTQTQLLGTFGDWGAYSANKDGRKVCFALAKPVSSDADPADRPRDPAYIFISSRPAENVRNEVSIVMGFELKPKTGAAVEIGAATFAMYTQNDGAWIRNLADQPRMIDAMRQGGELVVKGTSESGAESTDRYSLNGLGQALDRTAQECK